jgi:hypothetical protein
MNEQMLAPLVIPVAAISIFIAAAAVEFLHAYDIYDDIVLNAAPVKVFTEF